MEEKGAHNSPRNCRGGVAEGGSATLGREGRDLERVERTEMAKGFGPQLRRRKVVQWGIAYVAAGWGLLQGLEYLSSVFRWTEQLQRIATVGFLVGAADCAGARLVPRRSRASEGERHRIHDPDHPAAAGRRDVLVGGQTPERPVETGPPPIATPAAAETDEPSIAVLPFVNMSDDEANEYFSDGISEELLNVLVQVPGLGVASRTSSFGYKGSSSVRRKIAEALKVNHISKAACANRATTCASPLN